MSVVALTLTVVDVSMERQHGASDSMEHLTTNR